MLRRGPPPVGALFVEHGHLCGWLRVSLSSAPLEGGVGASPDETLPLDATPGASGRWTEVFVVLDGLNLSVYGDASGAQQLARWNVDRVAQSVYALPAPLSHVFAIRTAWLHQWLWRRPPMVHFDAHAAGLCARWVEAIYQTRAMRRQWSLTRYELAERVLCCCSLGADVVEQLVAFALVNLASMVVQVVSTGFDIGARAADRGKLSPREASALELADAVSLALDVVAVAALGMLSAMLLTHRAAMHDVLRDGRRLCWAMLAITLASLLLSLGVVVGERLFDHKLDDLGRGLWRRLQDWLDVTNLALWLNGLYIIEWSERVRAQDISFVLRELDGYPALRPSGPLTKGAAPNRGDVL
jgi:hypothetical protein